MAEGGCGSRRGRYLGGGRRADSGVDASQAVGADERLIRPPMWAPANARGRGQLILGADAGGHDDTGRSALDVPTDAPSPVGLVCVNPPYGVRLEDHEPALATQPRTREGVRERPRLGSWCGHRLAGAPDMELASGRYRTPYALNGALECRFLRTEG